MSTGGVDPVSTIRRMLEPDVTPDPEKELRYQNFVSYQCNRCQEDCLNPEQSVLHEAGTCLECHVHYAAHGHVRKRIFGRWD